MEIIDKIREEVKRGTLALGQKIPIPPVVGDTIARRRRRLSELDSINRKALQHHVGWAEAYGLCVNVGVSDSLTYYDMCNELAEDHGLMPSIVLAMKFKVFSEPARMYVLNGGPQVLVHEDKSTPALLRVAYEGAHLGKWDMEDVLTLPAPMIPVSSNILEHFEIDSFDEAEVYLA